MSVAATPAIDRILPRLVHDEYGCWIWPGAKTPKGYGVIKSKSNGVQTRNLVHRVVWEHFNGPMPAGFQTDHLCRVRHCANPDHLEAVVSRENTLRGNVASRSLVCTRGHWLLGPNVELSTGPNGATERRCRACKNMRKRAYRRGGGTPSTGTGAEGQNNPLLRRGLATRCAGVPDGVAVS